MILGAPTNEAEVWLAKPQTSQRKSASQRSQADERLEKEGAGDWFTERLCSFSNRLIDSFFSRMEAPVRLFQVGDRQVQVTLGGRQGAVPQDLLDVPQVRPVLE